MLFGFGTKIMSETYSFEWVKFYTSWFFDLYDVINGFCLKESWIKKIVKFTERKECNAEGKTSACQNTSFISATFYKLFQKKVYISKCVNGVLVRQIRFQKQK
jgi:hypothetical protein